MTRAVLFFGLTAGLATAQAVMTTTGGSFPPQHVRQLYTSLCGRCHGADGSGGSAPSLRVTVFRRAPDALSLMQIIVDGIPAAGMPPTLALSIPEVAALAAYVRGFTQAPATASGSGDFFRGELLFQQKGACGQCHVVRGKGGRLGPDLTGVGRRRTPAQLRSSILSPAESVPTDFVMVRATTRDGRKIAGVLLHQDTFTLRLRDSDARLHGLDKSALAELHYDYGMSPMPSYREKLSDAEIDDLVAYLAGLATDP